MSNIGKKKYSGRIPFEIINEIKAQMDYVESHWVNEKQEYYNKDVLWKENYNFNAKIKINSYSKGRSSVVFICEIIEVLAGESSDYNQFLNNCKCQIFISDMMDIISNHTLWNGESVYLPLCFCKRGSNYGLCLQPS